MKAERAGGKWGEYPAVYPYPIDQNIWFGFRQMGIDHLAFIQSRTEREYASHVYRAVWRWRFIVEERRYGLYVVSELEKLLVI